MRPVLGGWGRRPGQALRWWAEGEGDAAAPILWSESPDLRMLHPRVVCLGWAPCPLGPMSSEESPKHPWGRAERPISATWPGSLSSRDHGGSPCAAWWPRAEMLPWWGQASETVPATLATATGATALPRSTTSCPITTSWEAGQTNTALTLFWFGLLLLFFKMKKLSASLADLPKVTQRLKTKQNSEPSLLAFKHLLAVVFSPTEICPLPLSLFKLLLEIYIYIRSSFSTSNMLSSSSYAKSLSCFVWFTFISFPIISNLYSYSPSNLVLSFLPSFL